MTQLLSLFIFSVAALFGYELPMMSENTTVIINQDSQTIELQYYRLQTIKDYKEKVLPYLDSVELATAVSPKLNGLSLISKEKVVKDSLTSFIVKLKYENSEVLKRYFKIDLDSSLLFVHGCEVVLANDKQRLVSTDGYCRYHKNYKVLKFDYIRLENTNSPCDLLKNPVGL